MTTANGRGSALGLSASDISPVLRLLREDGFQAFRTGHITFDDLNRLVALTEFDRTYLDQDGYPLR